MKNHDYMIEKIVRYISIIFSVFWGIVIFTEYWNYNERYSEAFERFKYFDLLLILVVIGAGGTWLFNKIQSNKKTIKFLNGLCIFLFLVLLDIIAVHIFFNKIQQPLSISGLFLHLGFFIYLALCLYLIYLVCRIIGSITTIIFPPKILKDDLFILQTGLGIIIMTSILFILGYFHLLQSFILIPLFLLVLGIHWKLTITTLKNDLITPIKISTKLNAIGIFSFLFLFVFVVVDFAQLSRPFPLGTDSINLYVNLSSLIADYEGLVRGNQPYNWSLFMSLGLLIFGRVDVVLGLSFLGSILSLFALFRLSRRWLDVNYSALVLLLFFSVPMINFLSYMDMKIDMGLLFITLCVVILFVNWINPNEIFSPKKSKSKTNKKKGTLKQKRPKSLTINYLNSLHEKITLITPNIIKENHLLILIGIFIGFAFGIKLTSLFIFLAIMTGVWYVIGGNAAFITAIFLVIGTSLILGLDTYALLRRFHGEADVLQWLLMGLGIIGVGYLFKKDKKQLQKLITSSILLGIFFFLPVLPWLGKNYIETNTFSIHALLNGQQVSPPAIDFNKGIGKK